MESKCRWIDNAEEIQKDSKGHIYFERDKIFGLFATSFNTKSYLNYSSTFFVLRNGNGQLEVIQYIKDGKIQYRYV